MPYNVPFFRVFLSSPGDVNAERQIALEVLDRLPNRPAFREKVGFRVVAWDKPGADTPMLATMSPQAAIDAGLPKPSECDIVVVIFWSRMGTPFTMDGIDYQSGTHYELLDALNAKRPNTLIYHRTEQPRIDLNDDRAIQQYRRVQEFFKSDLFYDPQSGQIRRGVNQYGSADDFRAKFETHLEDVVVKLLTRPARSEPESAVEPAAAENIITIETRLWQGSPFPGLRAFQEKDAPIYFGRGAETDALVRRVSDSRFVEVVGASGSGKSSLVGAGLLPRLRANAISSEATGSKDWLIVRFTPGQGDSPFAALFDALIDAVPALRPSPLRLTAEKMGFIDSLQKYPQTLRDTLQAALAQMNAPAWAEVLLFIDQFEELFTLADARYIEPFAAVLRDAAASPVCRIVLTMRADFYHRAVEIPALTDVLREGTFPLAAPDSGALFQMITRPAELAALTFEPGLAERILTETGRDPGALALMAYALDELYKIAEERGDRRLTLADYERLGGVPGAIGMRAESIFAGLNLPDKEAILQRVFRELVEVDERGTATRRRAPVSRFTDAALELVDAFIAARLLTIDTVGAQHAAPEAPPLPVSEIEVAHEALFRNWERLRAWIETAQEDFILLRKLRQAAHEWHAADYPEFMRWSHERLAPVYEMQQRHNFDLDDKIRDFIEPEWERLLDGFIADERYHRRLSIIDRWGEIGKPALMIMLGLVAQIEPYEDAILTHLANTMVSVSDDTISLLLNLLDSPHSLSRRNASAMLIDVADQRAVQKLITALSDNELWVRLNAASALGGLGAISAVPHLIDALKDKEWSVRRNIAEALGNLGQEAAIPALSNLLKDIHPEVKNNAVIALENIGTPKALELLKRWRDATGGEEYSDYEDNP